jgi:hypothetical protein
MIHDSCTLLQEMITDIFMIQKVNISTGHILSCYEDMALI